MSLDCSRFFTTSRKLSELPVVSKSDQRRLITFRMPIHHWREALNHFTDSVAGTDAGPGENYAMNAHPASTEMGWGRGPLPQRPIPENNTWSFTQNSGHTWAVFLTVAVLILVSCIPRKYLLAAQGTAFEELRTDGAFHQTPP